MDSEPTARDSLGLHEGKCTPSFQGKRQRRWGMAASDGSSVTPDATHPVTVVTSSSTLARAMQ